jgi:hypothetical protein
VHILQTFRIVMNRVISNYTSILKISIILFRQNIAKFIKEKCDQVSSRRCSKSHAAPLPRNPKLFTSLQSRQNMSGVGSVQDRFRDSVRVTLAPEFDTGVDVFERVYDELLNGSVACLFSLIACFLSWESYIEYIQKV